MNLRSKLIELGILKGSIHLDIVGTVPERLIKLEGLKHIDPNDSSPNYFFTERNFVDIPLGTHFDVIFDMDDPKTYNFQVIKLVDISMRNRPNLPLISHGVNVIAKFEFEQGPPRFLTEQKSESQPSNGIPRRKIVFSSMDFYKQVMEVYESLDHPTG